MTLTAKPQAIPLSPSRPCDDEVNGRMDTPCCPCDCKGGHVLVIKMPEEAVVRSLLASAARHGRSLHAEIAHVLRAHSAQLNKARESKSAIVAGTLDERQSAQHRQLLAPMKKGLQMLLEVSPPEEPS